MPQQDINKTFYGQQYRKENIDPNDINAVEFRNQTPTNLPTNPKRIWINQPEESAYFTVDGINIIELARKSLIPFINVKDHPYNAKGNGTTNDTAALQSALNVARDAGSATIYIPDGTYPYTTYLRLYKNTTVIMGPNAIIKRTGSVNKCFVNGELGNANYVPAGGYTGEGNIHFYGGTIDMNQSVGIGASVTMSAFDLGHGYDISFHRLTIKNGQIGHYFQVSGCKNVRFYDCWFGNVVYSDMTSATWECLQIEKLNSVSFPSFGIFDSTPSVDILIDGCTFDGVIRGVGQHGTPPVADFPSNIRIVNCRFNNSAEDMITLLGYRDVIVDNCILTNVASNGINLTSTGDFKISNVDMANVGKQGVLSTDSFDGSFDTVYIKDSGTSSAGTYAALRIANGSNLVFDNTSVTYTTSPAYSRAFFIDGGGTGNRIVNHKFRAGTVGTIGGVAADYQALEMGNGQTVLFDGDLSTPAAIGSLSDDIRSYNYLIIVGNDGSSDTAVLTTVQIPKAIYTIGATTARYKIVLDDTSTTDRIDFSFPTATSIQVDVVMGTCHIRKVIGML